MQIKRWLRGFILITIVNMFFSTGVYSFTPTQKIVINVPALSLRLYHDDYIKKEYPIAVGVIRTPTPTGKTTVATKAKYPTYYPRHWLEKGLQPVPPGPDNPMGSRWLGLEWPHYGIHGTNAPNSIGTLVSQGCVRMFNKDVEELYELVARGTPVEIKYQVVELHFEGLDRSPRLMFYPDVYNYQPDYFEAAKALLKEYDLDVDIHPVGLRYLARTKRAEPVSLPQIVNISTPATDLKGFWVGYDIFIPLAGELVQIKDDRMLVSVVTVGGEEYITLHAVVESQNWKAQMITPTRIQLYPRQ